LSESNVCYLDYFVGGVPASAIFKMSFDDLKLLADSADNIEYITDTVYEVCLIGLVSYTEAFFKNHFASLINIHNPLIIDFSKKHGDVIISALDIINLKGEMSVNYGCLISEQYDFGPAKTINGLFMDLIGITPFSKDEQIRYSRLLDDRNLLVHHGGIVTTKYSRQRMKRQSVAGRVFLDSLVIKKNDFLEWYDFVYSIVRKTAKESKKSLISILENSSFAVSDEQRKALDALDWEVE